MTPTNPRMHLVTVRRHIPTDGLCYQEFEYMSGDITAGFRLDADVMPDTEYTFVHLTKYRDPATHLRIWQSPCKFHFWLPRKRCQYLSRVYIVEGTVSDANAWRLTIERASVASMVENWKGGTKKDRPLAKSLSTQYSPVSHP
jgi:hypothetical protein